MSRTLLVTGATGSVGSNVVALARAAGRPVRALVRSEADAAVLASMGAEPVIGDVTDNPRRVEAVDPTAPGAEEDPEFGGMVTLLRRDYPTPAFDASATNAELGLTMTPLRDGLPQTASWLRDLGRL